MTKDNRKLVKHKLDQVVADSLQDIGDFILRYLQVTTPHDTYDLLNSYIAVVNNDNTLTVGSSLEYAPYVELGTGPNYEKPPKWMTNNAQRGHHSIDPWWYMGDDGEWHLGWFIHAQPHLKPAFIDNTKDFRKIFKSNLENA